MNLDPAPSPGSQLQFYGTFSNERSSSGAVTRDSDTMNVGTDDQANNRPVATPAVAGSSSKSNDKKPANKRDTVWSWFTSQDLYLNNVGSVARDHLAVSCVDICQRNSN